MKRKIWYHVFLSMLLFVLVLIPCVYGWSTNFYVKQIVVDARVIGGYFASGNGTKDHPYEIANRRHLYNLAWLQYMGNFNIESSTNSGEYQTFYFTLSHNLDCEGLVLPPIGTGDNPFVSVFNGNGHTISNVKVSNNFHELVQYPNNVTNTNYQNVNVIGFFGVIGKYTGEENNQLTIPVVADGQGGTNVVTSVHDFYLDNIEINSNKENSLVGLLAGYVNGNVSNIGVHYFWFNLASGVSHIDNKKISNYTLIGDYNTSGEGGIDWSEKPDGAGMGFGGSVSILSIMDRMNYISSNNWAFPSLNFNGMTSSSSSHPEKGSYLSLVVDNEISPTYYQNNTSEVVSSNNIGYYTGNEAKVLGKVTSEQLVASDCFVDDGTGNLVTTSDIKDDIAKGNIKDINIYEVTGYGQFGISQNITQNVKDDVLSMVNDETGHLYSIRFSGQVEVNNWVTIENATVATKKYDKINIPPKSIWFTAHQDGMAKIVFCTQNNTTRGVSLYQIKRNGDQPYFSNNPGGGDVSISAINHVYHNSAENTYVYDIPAVTDGWEEVYNYDWYSNQTIGEDKIYYIQIPIMEGNEYAFGAQNSGEGYIMYLDIGQNGNVNPTYVGTIVGVDFVYAIDNGFNSFDDKSNVCFEVDSQTGVAQDVVVYFKRKQTIGVLYYATVESVDIVPVGSGPKGKSKDEKCDVQA